MARISFEGAKFADGEVSFDCSEFTGGVTSFVGAKINAEYAGGEVSFDGVECAPGCSTWVHSNPRQPRLSYQRGAATERAVPVTLLPSLFSLLIGRRRRKDMPRPPGIRWYHPVANNIII
jgi:hypothetical protein